MTFLEVLFVIIGAILVGTIFYYVFRTSGPWGTFWSFILILILAGIAASGWMEPVGPVYRDVSWVPVLGVVLIFAILLAAATPPYEYPERTQTEEIPEPPTTSKERAAIAMGVFFWILLVVLLAAALWGIFR